MGASGRWGWPWTGDSFDGYRIIFVAPKYPNGSASPYPPGIGHPRQVRIAPAGEQPADATDLKIFQVGVGGGAGKDAIRFQASRLATGNRVQTK